MGAVAAVMLVGGVATADATHRVVLSQGHVDVLDIAFEDGKLVVVVHDETVEPGVERDPDTVLFQVKPEAEVAVPADPAFGFLGDPGDPVWILPQEENPELLFAGFSSEELESGLLRNDALTIRLVGVCGPGEVSLFTVNEFGVPSVLADNANGLPDAIPFRAGQHFHLNWAFEAEGRYTLTWVVTGRLASNGHRVSSGLVHTVFHVGALS